MMPCYWYYFCIFYIFHFFQIIMVSLFLAWQDHYFVMFKYSNVFEFTNFPFKTNYNNTVVYFVFLEGKTRKKIVETILWLNLLSIYQYSPKTWWFLKGVLIHWRSLIQGIHTISIKKFQDFSRTFHGKSLLFEG